MNMNLLIRSNRKVLKTLRKEKQRVLNDGISHLNYILLVFQNLSLKQQNNVILVWKKLNLDFLFDLQNLNSAITYS